MKNTSKKKKQNKKPTINKLKKRCEDLFKEVCYLRDGKRCMVKLNYPDMNIQHSTVFQVDHCFTRANKHLFFEPKNGTVVCSTCNMLKHLQLKSVGRAIDMIVMKREGEDQFNYMFNLDRSFSPNHDFSKRWYLEQKEIKLKETLCELELLKNSTTD